MKDAYTGLCRAVATGTPTQSAYSSSNVPRNIGKAECGFPLCQTLVRHEAAVNL